MPKWIKQIPHSNNDFTKFSCFCYTSRVCYRYINYQTHLPKVCTWWWTPKIDATYNSLGPIWVPKYALQCRRMITSWKNLRVKRVKVESITGQTGQGEKHHGSGGSAIFFTGRVGSGQVQNFTGRVGPGQGGLKMVTGRVGSGQKSLFSNGSRVTGRPGSASDPQHPYSIDLWMHLLSHWVVYK